MSVKLGNAYIAVSVSMEGAQREISKQLSGLGKVGQDVGKDLGKGLTREVEKSAKSVEKVGKDAGKGYAAQFGREASSSLGKLGDRMFKGIGKGLLTGAAAAGTAVAGTLGASIAKGFSRLTNIDQAEAKLRGLGHSAESVSTIMDSANEAVLGTAFGLDEAATAAAGAVAAGIEPGEELERTLTLMGDAAAIAGTDMGSMSSIFNKVATDGRLQGDVIAQLGDAGIPVLSLLAEEMGVTAEEARDMASSGEVSFEIFQNAMEAGLGGAAQSAGDTFRGSLANMGAAMGRFGAALAEPVFENLPLVFGAIGDAFGLLQEKVGPLAEDFGEWLAPKVEEFAEALGPWLVERVEQFADAIGNLSNWLQGNAVWLKPVVAGLAGMAGAIAVVAGAMSVYNKAMALYRGITAVATGATLLFNNALKTNVFIAIAAAIIGVVSGLIYFFTQTELGIELWSNFTEFLGNAWDWVTDTIGAGVDWLVEKFQQFTDWISGIWGTVSEGVGAGLDWISGLFTGFVEWISEAWSGVVGVFQSVWDAIVEVGQVAVGIIGAVVLAPLLIAWNLLSEGFRIAWENVIKPVWDAIVSFAQDTLWPILDGVFTWIGDAFQAMGDFLASVWGFIRDNIFQPIASFIVDVVQATFEAAIDGIVVAWQFLSDGINAAWGFIRDNILNPLMGLVQAVWDHWMAVLGWMVDRFNWLRDMLGAAWAWISENVFAPMRAGIQAVADWFSARIDNIVGFWQRLQDMMHAGWRWIDDNVFTAFKNGLQAVQDFASSIVDGIGRVWNNLRSLLAKPINFMINTVYNDGILVAWNTIAGFLPGLDEATPLAGIPEHATGGRISGPGNGTSDDVLMWGSNGEHMLTAADVQRFGGHSNVYAMRDMLQSGRAFSYDGRGGIVGLPRNVDSRAGDLAGAAPDLLLPAFATGGEIRPLWESQLERGHAWAASRHGRPYVLGGSAEGGGGTDCSGFMSGIASVIQGGNGARQWATMAFNGGGNSQYPSGPQGFVQGLKANTLSIGVTNGGTYGGHTAGTLGAVGQYGTVNVEAGGSPSMVKYGTGAAGADHSQFRTHYHLPIGPDGAFVSGGGGGMSPESMMGGLKDKVSGLIDKAMNPILSLLPEGPPEWQNIPRGVYDRGKDGMLDTTFGVIEGLGDQLASVWTSAGEVKDLVTGAVGDAASWVNDTVRSIVVRDNGGIVRSGQVAVNMSGRDELMLPPETTALMNRFFREFPGVAVALTDVMKDVEKAAVAMEKAMDFTSVEGVTARQTTRAVLDLGVELPGADLITAVLDGEATLWAGRERHLDHLNSIAEQEKALAEAQDALTALRNSDAEDAEKHAEDVAKATDDVKAAEESLAQARRDQVKDLDHIVLLSQDMIGGLLGQAGQLAGQLTAMGAPAAMVSQGLGAVTGALSQVAGLAGPAGISLGMALTAAQVVIQIVQVIDTLFKEWLAGIACAKTAQLEAMNEYLGNISQVTSAIHDQRSAVVELASTVVSAFIRMGDAARSLSAATAGVFQAGLDGAKNVADIQKQIRDLRKQSSGGGAVSAPVPWDMGLMYDSYSNELTASPKVKTSSQSTSLRDVVSEIAALNWDLQAALIDQQIMVKQAQLDQIRAEFEALRSRLNLDRAFHDLIQGVQRLEALQRIQVELGITEQQARIQQEINQQLIARAQAEAVRDDPLNRIGSFLDFDGDGKVFGIFDNMGSKATQAAESSIAANNKQIEALGKIMEQYGGSAEVSPEAVKAAEDVAYFMKEGRDDLAEMAKNGSPLGDALRASHLTTLAQDLWEIDDRNESSRRAVEDLELYFKEYLATQPLQDEIDQMTHARESYTAQAELMRASSEDVKLAAAALRDFHSEAAAREPQVVTVNVPASGQTIDADDLAATIDGLGTDISGLDFRVRRVESMNAPKSNAVLARKR